MIFPMQAVRKLGMIMYTWIMHILFLTPYPIRQAPSQRFRFEQYFEFLEEKGYKWTIRSFLGQKAWENLYHKRAARKKLAGILTGFLRRGYHLFEVPAYDLIFIHREVAPVGPPVFEWIIAKIFKKRIIYDFDDAIWLEDPSEKDTLLARLKWKSKVGRICRWSWKVSCGNDYLCEFARRYNRRVTLNPTTIDTEKVHDPKLVTPSAFGRSPLERGSVVRVGWTGTHSTLVYLKPVIPMLQKLEEKFPLEFLVIANHKPDFSLKSLKFIPWQKETEIEDLLQLDIGIMPLTDDEWSKGKCGFKALQYLALEIPAVVSPIGVNDRIVLDETNGFLCDTPEDWYSKLSLLIKDETLRKTMGLAGRKHVEDHFSVRSNRENFLQLFDDQ